MQRPLAAFLALGLLCAAAPPLSFVPLNPSFTAGAEEYRLLWESDGARIVAALEAYAGVEFPLQPVEILVRDGPPMTSYDGRTIRLRANCSARCKLGTFTHELGHRLALELPRTAEIDDHRLLYLFLYDAWIELYGQDFADRMVSLERRIPGVYDYDAAWTWALSMSREQRQARLRELRAQAMARPRLDYAFEALLNAS